MVGPSGTAYVGEFGNVVVILSLLSTASIGTGIVKYVSEYKNKPNELKKLIQTAFGLILMFSIPISLLILFSSKFLTVWTFGNLDFRIVFILLGFLLISISMYQLFVGMLSGFQEVKFLAAVNIVASVINLVITIILLYQYKVIGALISNIIFNSLSTVFSLVALRKLGYLKKEFLQCKIDWIVAKQLMKFGAYGAVTTLSLMTTLLIVRNFLESKFGLESAGIWQGMYSLSDRYLSFIMAILNVYYLPRLSEIVEPKELIREVRKGFKRIMPLVIVISFTIYFCRDLIIKILLAKSFTPMRDLFAFQMIGDVFKVAAALFGYLVFARAMILTGLKAELCFHLIYLLSSLIFVQYYGLPGISYGFAFSTFILFCIYVYFFRDLIIQMKKSVLPKPWFK
jgi:PST family polysaccharide transporter